MSQAKQAEPPSWLRSRPYMVGQDRRGNWVVRDPRGIRGGLFVDRTAALRFVRSETGDRPQAVVMVSEGLELDLSRKPDVALHRQPSADSQRQLRFA